MFSYKKYHPSPFLRTVQIFLLILIVIGIVLLSTQKIWVPKFVAHILAQEETSIPIKETSVVADLYPLYSGVTWNTVKPETLEGILGTIILSASTTNITNIANFTKPFENYYTQKLQTLGWNIDNTRLASGPGSEFVAYTKGSQEIIFGFTTFFKGTKANEPVQCPCDTSFFVFSGSIMKN